MHRQGIVTLLKNSIVAWAWSEATIHAAAMAYYAIFSIAPLFIISTVITTQLFSQAAVEGKIVGLLQDTIGKDGAIVVQDILINSRDLVRPSGLATCMTVLFGVYGACALFRQLRFALNAMWGIVPKSETVHQSLFGLIKEYALAVTSVLTVGGILVGALLLNAFWTAVPAPFLHAWFPNLDELVRRFRLVASPVLFMGIFAVIFKCFPQAHIRWRDVWLGAAVTSLLVWLGSYLMGLWLSASMWPSIYGAAGSLIAVLIWIYYSAWIVLFGATFTHEYAAHYGTAVVPAADAQFVSPSPSP